MRDDPHRTSSWSSSTDGIYRRAVDALAARLQEAAADRRPGRHSPDRSAGAGSQHEAHTGSGEPGHPSTSEPLDDGEAHDEHDLLATLERLDLLTADLPARATAFESSLWATLEAFEANATELRATSGRSAPRIRTAVRRLAQQTAAPAQDLDDATRHLSGCLSEIDALIGELLDAAHASGEGALDATGFRELLSDSLPPATLTDRLDPDELRRIRSDMQLMGRTARELRPIARSLERAVALVTEMDAMTRRWHELAGA